MVSSYYLIEKIAVYTSPAQLCGVVKSQPVAALGVALVGTWQVAPLIDFCFHDGSFRSNDPALAIQSVYTTPG